MFDPSDINSYSAESFLSDRIIIRPSGDERFAFLKGLPLPYLDFVHLLSEIMAGKHRDDTLNDRLAEFWCHVTVPQRLLEEMMNSALSPTTFIKRRLHDHLRMVKESVRHSVGGTALITPLPSPMRPMHSPSAAKALHVFLAELQDDYV